jgi:hypothetical protein
MTHERPFTGATVVITHRVRDDKLAEYEEWLKEISPLAKASPGNLDWHIVRPIPGLTATFTLILRWTRFLESRFAFDIFAPTLYQRSLAEFLKTGHFARHLRRMRRA